MLNFKKVKDEKNKEFKAFVRTYGCQQNFSDSEKIKGILKSLGFLIVDDEKKADLILFNTCAIREHAEDRVFGNVGALKNLKATNKRLIIAVCGCMPEQEHVKLRFKKSFPFVDVIFGTGNSNKESLKDVLYKTMQKKGFFKDQMEFMNKDAEKITPFRDSKIKASIPIMYGCDNFCSYCVVPLVRGRERSRPSSEIISEIKDVLKKGYKEITLLGQNVNSYGKNLEEKINFSELLREIDSLKGDFFLRFMTSHPKDITFELIDTIASSKHICKHLHIPVQAGNDKILKLMNRHYTREKYLEIINYAKQKINNLSLTSDIIVGFPGETYSDFKKTLDLIKEVEFNSLFTFIYSKRKGTKAAILDDPISYEEKQKWFKELLDVQSGISKKNNQKLEGKVLRALVEEFDKEKEALKARLENNSVVELRGKESLVGSFVDCKIIKVKTNYFLGEIL